MTQRTWWRLGLFSGTVALGLLAVPATVRAQDAATKQDSAQPAAGAQQNAEQAGAQDRPAGRRRGQGQGGQGGGFGAFGGGARNPAQAVDRMREDTTALKLRDDQKTKLEAIFKDAGEQAKSLETEVQSLQPRERAQKVQPFMSDLRDKINGVLDDEQRQTLRRNQGTRQAKQMADRMKETVGQLDLSSEQKTKIDAILADMEKKSGDLAVQGNAGGGGIGGPGGGVAPGGGRGAGGPAFGLMRETREKINEVLTPEQRQKFQELQPTGGRGRRGGAAQN